MGSRRKKDMVFAILEILEKSSCQTTDFCGILFLQYALRIVRIEFAGVMELVDVADSKSAGGDIVWVRVPPPAPKQMPTFDAVGGTPTASVVSGVFDPRIFSSQTGDINEGFQATGEIRPLVTDN